MNTYILTSLVLSTGILAKCPAKLMCYEGGDLNKIPLTGPNFPECWVEEQGYWGCFDKGPGFCDMTNEHNGEPLSEIKICYNQGVTKRPNPSDIKPAQVLPVGDACLKPEKCYHGSQIHVPETKIEKFPQCWYNHGDLWGCYNAINGTCNDINGRKMFDINDITCRDYQTSMSNERCWSL